MTWLLIAGAGLILLPLLGKMGLGSSSVLTGTPPPPGSPYSGTVPGVGDNAPGAVSLGGSPAPQGWAPSNVTHQATAVAGTAVAATGAIGSAVSGGAGAFAATGLGAALPVIGIGVAAVGIVLGIIAKHHADAVATEAKDLTLAVPHCVQHFVLVIQSAIAGNTVAQCKQLLDQGLADYYTAVRGIQKGKWPCQGDPSAFVNLSLGVIGDPVGDGKCGHSLCGRDPQLTVWQNGHPDPCNGPCVVGHVLDGFRLYCIQVCAVISKGGHGVAVLKQIPSHAGFSGMPEVRVSF